MLPNPTSDKLRAMRLEGMVEALEEQRRQSGISQLDFEERLALLVERQWLWKENRSLAARLRNAQLKIANASLEDINYRHSRGLKRAQIDQLRASAWVQEHRNCIITGPTGIGKSYLACAFGHQACRDGLRTQYFYAPKLFRTLESAHADGSLAKLLKTLARLDLFIIDDLGLAAAKPRQYRDLLEVVDDRIGRGATLLTSQYPVARWHDTIGDATVADALLDRLVHNAYRLELDGKSMRDPKSAAAD
jgi:DNA replication protein DnaC